MSFLLNEFEEELEIRNPFTEEQSEQLSNIRSNVRIIFENVFGNEEIATDVERGCHLYSCMISCVDCFRDDKLFQRWAQCYAVKTTEVSSSVAIAVCNNLAIEALMAPFIRRSILFESTRLQIWNKVQERIATDKKIFDAEHDRSNIESDFQCPKCQSFKTRQYPLQMRSADEPMSILWQCFACNKSGIEK